MATFSEVQDGLRILAEYEEGEHVRAEYERLFAGGPPPDEMKGDDADELDRIGWLYDARQSCWLLLV